MKRNASSNLPVTETGDSLSSASSRRSRARRPDELQHRKSRRSVLSKLLLPVCHVQLPNKILGIYVKSLLPRKTGIELYSIPS